MNEKKKEIKRNRKKSNLKKLTQNSVNEKTQLQEFFFFYVRLIMKSR